ncbi:MAG: DUF4390 domain-containing protein [Steroidobacteraceae bacterium]
MTRAFAMAATMALAVGLSSRIRADALDGVLQVSSAYVDIDHSVYQLHARIEYPMTPSIENALHDGVTLSFEVEARVTRDRHFWFDPIVADVTLHRELAYHSISDRYVVRDVRGGEQQSFSTLDDALAFLSKVDGWPVLVTSQLAQSEQYHISVRAGIRRGRLPASLRALLFWTDDWNRESGWYTWTLPS